MTLNEQIQKILSEAVKKNEEGMVEEVSPRKIISTIRNIFETTYKKLLYAKVSDLIYVSTNKKPDQLLGYSDDEDDFYLALSEYFWGSELHIVIGNASSGAYEGQGIMVEILTALFAMGANMYLVKKRVLIIKDDRSDGIWKHIATKIGVEYVNDEN